jgi:hypothetical protein
MRDVETDAASLARFRKREILRYIRFNRRTHGAAVSGIGLQLLLILIHAASGASLAFTFLNLLIWLSASFVVLIEVDFLLLLLATHVNWMYSFSAYLYSSAHLRLVDDNLYGPISSIELAFVYNLSCVSAYLLFRLGRIFCVIPFRPLRDYGRALAVGRLETFLLLSGLALQLANAMVVNSTISALATQFRSFLWLGLALHFLKVERFRFDFKSGSLIAMSAAVASSTNSRTTLLLSLFFFCYPGYTMRIAYFY